MAGARATLRTLWAPLVALSALAYGLWFLTFPILNGLQGADGSALSRAIFLSRTLLPDEWIREWTGAGQLPSGIFDRVPIWLATALWLTVGWWIGRPLFAKVGLKVTRAEQIALSTLAGLSLLSTLVLMIGLSGGVGSRWPLMVGAVALCCASAWMQRGSQSIVALKVVPWLPESMASLGAFGQLFARLIVALTLALAVLYAFAAAMPPYEFDVVEYHLQSAKEFYQQGYIGFSAHNIYINMPLGLEMHSLAAMSLVNGEDGWWLGGLIGKSIIGSHSLLAALLIGGFVARKLNSRWLGWCAAGLWFSVPGNAHVTSTGLIDAALGTYLVASAICAVEMQSNRSKWLVLLAFLFAGAAAAAKYPGLLYAVAPCALVLVLLRRFDRVLPAVVALLLTCMPWYAKNAVLAGNPVYPLAYGLFGGRGLDADMAAQWAAAHRVPVEGGSAYSMAALTKSLLQFIASSEFVQPALIVLATCGILGGLLGIRQTRREVLVWCGWSVGIMAVWWLATHRIDRFWLPVVSLLVILAGYGLSWLAQQVSLRVAIGIVVAGIGYGMIVNSSPVIGDNRFFVALDALRSDSGDDQRPGRLSPAVGWCNQNLATGKAKVLLIGEAKAFDFKMPIVYSTCFNLNPAEGWLRGRTADEQRQSLQDAGITHVMVNWSEIARYRSPGNYGFSSWPTPSDFEPMVASGVLQKVEWPIPDNFAVMYSVADPRANH